MSRLVDLQRKRGMIANGCMKYRSILRGKSRTVQGKLMPRLP